MHQCNTQPLSECLKRQNQMWACGVLPLSSRRYTVLASGSRAVIRVSVAPEGSVISELSPSSPWPGGGGELAFRLHGNWYDSPGPARKYMYFWLLIHGVGVPACT